jgi:CBS domain-containing protein
VLREYRVRHLPVVRGQKLVGLVSHRDFVKALEISRRRGHEKVWAAEFMNNELVTVAPDSSLDAAVQRMVQRKIGCLPVTQDGRFVGLITETDVLNYCDRLIQDLDRKAEAADYETDA